MESEVKVIPEQKLGVINYKGPITDLDILVSKLMGWVDAEEIEYEGEPFVVYFSPTDSYTQFYQSLGRCHRAKQKKKVTVYHFTTKNTVEEKIYNALGQKRDFNWELYNCF